MSLVSSGIPAPFPMQHASLEFGSLALARLLDTMFTPGIGAAGELAVSQKSGSPNMSVDVAIGSALVKMTTPYGGVRFLFNDATSNSGAPGSPNLPDWTTTFAAADGSNPRIDRVVLQVLDSNIDGGGLYRGTFKVVAGTPTSGANLSNLNGAAAIPAASLLLANVLIPAASSSVTNGNIDNAAAAIAGYRLTPAVGPRVRIMHSGTQPGVASQASPLTPVTILDTEGYDSGGWWTSDAFTPTKAGIYHISTAYGWSGLGGAGVRYHIGLLKNGSTFVSVPFHSGSSTDVGATLGVDVEMNGTSDTLQLGCAQESGSTRTVNSAFFMAHYVGPTS